MPEPHRTTTPRRLSRRTLVLGALAPSFVLQLVVPTGLLNIEQMIGILVALFLAIAFVRRPEGTVRLLIVILPFQLVLSAALYRMGVAGPLVRMLGLWKELAVLSLGVALLTTSARTQRGLDALDGLCAAFVALGTLYLLIPQLSSSSATIGLDDRFISWRSTVLPVVLLVIVRHLRFSGDQAERVVGTLVKVGVALGCIAVFEVVASGVWNHLLVDTLGVNRFRIDVLDLSASALRSGIDDIRTQSVVGGRQIVRAGGPMIDCLGFAFLLLVVLAFQGQRMVQSVQRPGRSSAIALVGLGIVLSQTRSAAFGLGVIAAVALLPVVGRSEKGRARLAVLVTVAVVVVVPLALTTGAASRLASGDSSSDRGHAASVRAAVDVVTHAPLGNGLGSGAIGSNRSGTIGAITPENQFLDVGVQLGIVGMVLFALVLLAALVRLGRAAKRAPAGSARIGAAGARTALLALLVPCWYLQPFVTPEVGWLAFMLVGLSLGAADRVADEADEARSRPELSLGRV
jgi:hypothetical protein